MACLYVYDSFAMLQLPIVPSYSLIYFILLLLCSQLISFKFYYARPRKIARGTRERQSETLKRYDECDTKNIKNVKAKKKKNMTSTFFIIQRNCRATKMKSRSFFSICMPVIESRESGNKKDRTEFKIKCATINITRNCIARYTHG